jgi:hypothetical protein
VETSERWRSYSIANNPSKAGWSWGCVATVDSRGRTIFVADAHRDDGKRFVVRTDEQVTAFVELESAIRAQPAVGWSTLVGRIR